MMHPIATAADRKKKPLSALPIALKLDFFLDATEAAYMRQEFVPLEMEDKWFLYCEGNTLCMHGSWAGFSSARVHLVSEGDGRRAVSADVNGDPEHYPELPTMPLILR